MAGDSMSKSEINIALSVRKANAVERTSLCARTPRVLWAKVQRFKKYGIHQLWTGDWHDAKQMGPLVCIMQMSYQCTCDILFNVAQKDDWNSLVDNQVFRAKRFEKEQKDDQVNVKWK